VLSLLIGFSLRVGRSSSLITLAVAARSSTWLAAFRVHGGEDG
jgi:hypothetical protein